ncbi:MAG: hypothetical protein IJQ75_02625 [Synergistaceae bacterium]|nr:hypothetical protein [Synergistaceae bacterium]
MCSTVCYGGERFSAFPTVGVCTGSNVRYRSQPNTNADIWGSLKSRKIDSRCIASLFALRRLCGKLCDIHIQDKGRENYPNDIRGQKELAVSFAKKIPGGFC